MRFLLDTRIGLWFDEVHTLLLVISASRFRAEIFRSVSFQKRTTNRMFAKNTTAMETIMPTSSVLDIELLRKGV